MSKNIKERAERNAKIRRTVAQIEKTVNKLERMKDEYLQKATDAKARGDSASYALAKSGLNVTLSQIKRANEMLLNIEITTELQKMGEVNSDFLTGMSVIAKRIGKINKQSDFVKLQKEIEKALSGMEEAQAGLDVFLQNTDAQFAAISQSEGSLSDKQIDELVDGKVSERELLMDAQIDGLLGGKVKAVTDENIRAEARVSVGGNDDNGKAEASAKSVAKPFPEPLGRFVFDKKSSPEISYSDVLGGGEECGASVMLADVIEKREELGVFLGRTGDGEVVHVPFSEAPAILVGGVIGSGKSVFIHQLICSTVLTHSAETVLLVLIDLKNEELSRYNGIPHLAANAVTDAPGVMPTLKALQAEIDRRYELTAEFGGNIKDYNAQEADKLPYIIVVIDELKDVIAAVGGAFEREFGRVSRQAAAVGVYFVAATRVVDKSTLTPLISAAFPARAAFRTDTKDASKLLGAVGADEITGAGELLFVNGGKSVKCVAPHVTEKEINKVVAAFAEDRI